MYFMEEYHNSPNGLVNYDIWKKYNKKWYMV